MEINVGNIVFFEEDGINKVAKVMAVESSYRMDGSVHTKIKIYYDVIRRETVNINDIKGIPLTADVLEKIGAKKTKVNEYCVESLFDTAINITKDWRIEPSYHIGIEYTDSPFDFDKGITHNFSHGVKYVHELQNILNAIYNTSAEEHNDMPNFLNFDNLFDYE